MGLLPGIKYGSGIGTVTQVRFGGLRHTVNCSDGELYDMENLSARFYPVLATRPRRWKGPRLPNAGAIYADRGVLMYIDSAQGLLYYKSWPMLTVAVDINDPAQDKFVRFGDRVILTPAMVLLNTKAEIMGVTETKSGLPATAAEGEAWAVGVPGSYRIWVCAWDDALQAYGWSDAGYFATNMRTGVWAYIKISDGTFAGEEAKANTLEIMGTEGEMNLSDFFKVGDGVRLSGFTKIPANNKTAIIREIDGGTLRFSEDCFTMPEDEEGNALTEYQEVSKIQIDREIPKAAIWFEHENRLWAAAGKTIYASKLGDPLNFNVFDGLATDSWALETQKKGEFTAGCSYGYPVFFREGSILRIYGRYPAAFQTHEVEAPGVMEGMGGSLATAGGRLFYQSRDGIMAYNGEDWPEDQQQVFGWPELRPERCTACSDGVDLYLYMDYGTAAPVKLYHYDALRGLWMIEHARQFTYMTLMDGLEDGGSAILTLEDGDVLVALKGRPEGWTEEESFSSFAEFGDFTDSSPNRKGMTKVQLRVRAEEGTSMKLRIQYDSSGVWETVREFTAGRKDSYYLPVLPRRCDHYRLRLEAEGDWELYSMSRELYTGSAKK